MMNIGWFHVRRRVSKGIALVMAAVLSLNIAIPSVNAHTDTSNMSDAIFFSKINLDYPGLATVKANVLSNDYTAAKANLLAYYKARTSPQYFSVGTTPVTNPMMSTADDLVNGVFKFTDGQTQTFTTGVNWNYHWNPSSPSSYGGPHYYTMDFMMNSVLAPSYNALPPGDPKRTQYADTWLKFTMDYIDKVGNLLTFDVGNNQLDMANRSVNWLSAYSLMKDDAVLDADANTAFLKHMWEMSTMMYNGIEGTSGNNWYMFLAYSLYAIGMYFPEFKDAEKWMMRGEGATYKYMSLNMKGDGMNYEPTENYHWVALRLANKLQTLGNLNGYSVLDDLSELIERGGEVLMDLSLPNFEMPMLGDSAEKNLGITGLMNYYASDYGRSDFQYIATKGASGTTPSSLSVLYPNSFAIMKTGWDTNDKYMVIENEDTTYTGSHSHRDDLSLMMYAYGKRLIVDPGVNDYLDVPSSNWLRNLTRAHNTVEIDYMAQGNLGRKHVSWYSNGGFDFYHGQHKDYNPIQHDRKVFFAKPGFWIVSDLLTGGTTSKTYRQYWHFMPTTVNLDPTSKRASTSFAGEANVKLVPADPGTLTATVLTDGYYSDEPNVVQSNVQYLSYGRTATGSTSFDTVVFPEDVGSNRNVTVSRLTTGVAETVATAIQIDHDAGNNGNVSAYYLSHEATPVARNFGSYHTDGEVGYVEKTSTGALVTASLARGTLLKDGATNLISATATVNNLSASYTGTTLDLFSSDVLTPTITIYAPGVTTVRLNGSAISFTTSGNSVVVGGSALPTTGTTVLTDNFDVIGLDSQTWDFESGMSDGWVPREGTWSVTTPGASKVYHQTNSSQADATTVTQTKWSDVLVEAKVTTNATSASTWNGVGLFARYQDAANNYLFRYYSNGGSPILQIAKNFNNTASILATVPYTMINGTTYTMKAIASGNVLKLYINNVLQLTAYDTDLEIGYAGLNAHRRDVYFDDVKVTEIMDGDKWDINKGHFLINNFELFSDSLNETNSEIRTRIQNDWSKIDGRADVKVVAWGTAPSRAGIVARSLNGNNGYRFVVYNDGSNRTLRIEKVVSGLRTEATPVVLAEKAFTFNTNTYYTFRAVLHGGILKFYVNGNEELTAYDSMLSKGGFGLHASKAQVRFDNVVVNTLP